ncbi:Glutamyl-tRNA (Gln) amidotransferase subunit A (DUF620) [Melia azedarach]|uniref:Glutamyl-tRNA (Gln) amidotransferase subunit A (DUF620) n=1 Tax=Melia azedarach TaxID=155640 RepID=A0ACC1WQ96_MELAZ|nr:Glutamyl-tRNA (Gln) amidotransferase subunit A (DUF620) [Melia azedarach]
MGKVRMVAAEFETATRIVKNGNASSYAEFGGFVLWLMNPDMWYFEIAVGGSKVYAGYNGKLVWRHAPWSSAHTAKGLARPLCHALQTGFLVEVEDSRLTRIQFDKGDTIYWETTINLFLDDYKLVKGIMIAHSGRYVVTCFRFGEVAMSHTKIKMEEAWTTEGVAFNVPGLSIDCFIPPSDLRAVSISEACELLQDEKGKSAIACNTSG